VVQLVATRYARVGLHATTQCSLLEQLSNAAQRR
jgi:hypothetical protein